MVQFEVRVPPTLGLENCIESMPGRYHYIVDGDSRIRFPCASMKETNDLAIKLQSNGISQISIAVGNKESEYHSL